MIGSNKVWSNRTGQFIGSIRDGKDYYDAYFNEGNIILVNGENEFKASVIEIVNKPDEYLFTPFLEAYNGYKYTK